jgi:hypothetical protein
MLLPLIEMIFGSRFMGDSSRRPSYWPFSRSGRTGGSKQTGSNSNNEKGGRRTYGGDHSRKLSTTASGDTAFGDDLQLGDAAPGKTEITSSPADSSLDRSQESIMHDESIGVAHGGGARRGSGGEAGRIVRHDRVIVEYEQPSEERNRRTRWR